MLYLLVPGPASSVRAAELGLCLWGPFHWSVCLWLQFTLNPSGWNLEPSAFQAGECTLRHV